MNDISLCIPRVNGDIKKNIEINLLDNIKLPLPN